MTATRGVVLAGVGLVVIVGLFWAFDSPAEPAPSPTVAEVVAPGVGESVQGRLPTADLADAHDVARAFATALFRDDLDTLAGLVSDELAVRLLDPGRHPASTGGGQVAVDGVTTHDAQPGRVLVKVAIRRTTDTGGHLDVVTVALEHSHGRWQVTDTAF